LAQTITETTKSLKTCYTFNTTVMFILKSYIDELKWRNNEWAALGCALLNVLFASCINVYHLH